MTTDVFNMSSYRGINFWAGQNLAR
jgi:hypothetical protein